MGTIHQIVYVIKSSSTGCTVMKVLDYIMDFNHNIICWDKKENAESYILHKGLENKYRVFQTTTNKIENELLLKKNDLKKMHFGIRIIEGILF
jgi:hypothetical protein